MIRALEAKYRRSYQCDLAALAKNYARSLVSIFKNEENDQMAYLNDGAVIDFVRCHKSPLSDVVRYRIHLKWTRKLRDEIPRHLLRCAAECSRKKQ